MDSGGDRPRRTEDALQTWAVIAIVAFLVLLLGVGFLIALMSDKDRTAVLIPLMSLIGVPLGLAARKVFR